MTTFRRRGACPGLSDPMPTGDGLLVRFSPTAPIALASFAALCAAVRRDGNGAVEISQRGSLQVRGLTEQSAPRFAAAVAALGIAAAGGTVLSSPLDEASDALVNSAALAATLHDAISAAPFTLSPKLSVVVDGGGQLHLDAVRATLRVRAIGPPQDPRLYVLASTAAGRESPLGFVARDQLIPLMLALLRAISDQKRGNRDAGCRLADFGIREPPASLPLRRTAEPIGRHPLRDGTLALGIALAFGHAQAETLAELARSARRCGARAVRPAPGRALLLIGIAEENAASLAAAAERLGFIVDTGDPRRRIVACPGAPACASGLIAARALAAQLAASATRGRPGDFIHVSGCPKGCAHPMAAVLTVVGTERGCGIIRGGTARAVPDRYVDPADLAAAVAAAIAPHLEVACG